MSRVLVTGATGSVGSRVVALLAERGNEVIALARQGSSLARLSGIGARMTVRHADLMVAATVQELVMEVRPEAVLHLGWQGIKGNQRNSPAQVENLLASINLYKAARDAGCGVMVGVGSQAEYGNAPGKISEDSATRPITAYGAAKLATGLMLERMAHADGIHFAWLRLFSSYGPGDDPDWLLQYVARSLMAGKRPATTPAQQLWDYVYVDDVAMAVCVAMEARLKGFYNVGSGEARRLEDILYMLRDIIDPALPIGIGERPYAVDQIWHLEADIDKLRSATQWTPLVDLPGGLANVVDWIRRNG